jgi:hypothetical protein
MAPAPLIGARMVGGATIICGGAGTVYGTAGWTVMSLATMVKRSGGVTQRWRITKSTDDFRKPATGRIIGGGFSER